MQIDRICWDACRLWARLIYEVLCDVPFPLRRRGGEGDGGGGGGGRTGHAWRKHGGKRMRWSDKQPPTFDHRLVSWIHFNAPRRTAFRGSFYFTSYRSRATLRSKWKRLIFFVSLLFVERIRDPARFGIEFVFIRSEYAVLLGIGIIKGSNARIFFGNFSISFYILSFRCVNSIDNC